MPIDDRLGAEPQQICQTGCRIVGFQFTIYAFQVLNLVEDLALVQLQLADLSCVEQPLRSLLALANDLAECLPLVQLLGCQCVFRERRAQRQEEIAVLGDDGQSCGLC